MMIFRILCLFIHKHLHATIFFLVGYLFQSILIPTILDIRSLHKAISFVKKIQIPYGLAT